MVYVRLRFIEILNFMMLSRLFDSSRKLLEAPYEHFEWWSMGKYQLSFQALKIDL